MDRVLWTEALRVEELRRAQPEYRVLVIRQGDGAGVTCGRSLGGLEGQAKWFLALECLRAAVRSPEAF